MQAPPTHRPWKLWISQLASYWRPLADIAAACTMIGFFGQFGWLLDIAGIFRMQYTVVLLIGVIIFSAARRWKRLVLSIAAIIINLVTILPLYMAAPDRVTAGDKFCILQMNVNNLNRQYIPALNQIHELSPDILCVEELDPHWDAVLVENLTDYPYQKRVVQTDSFGIGIFSKLPLENAQVHFLGKAQVPCISTTVKLGQKSFRLVSVHVLPPRLLHYFNDRNLEYKQIVDLLVDEQKPVVLAGDLNSPPWSYYFQKLIADGHFIDSEIGHGIQATWPTNSVFLLIPIDHLFTRGNIHVINRSIQGNINSDHFPLLTELSLP